MNRPTSTSEGFDRNVPSSDVVEVSPTTARAAPKERVFVGTGLFWGLIIGVVLAIGVLVLVAQNTESITMAFLGWDFSTPLIVLILGALLIGVVLTEICGLFYRSRRRRTQRDRDHLERLQQSQTVS
jgi:uncharacterized integral membrane protein